MGHTLSNLLKFAQVHWWDKIVWLIQAVHIKSALYPYYITLVCMEKANGSLFSVLCLSEKYSGDALGIPRNGDTPADIQRLVNQRVKLRGDLWQPDFRPPDEGRSKTERSLGLS